MNNEETPSGNLVKELFRKVTDHRIVTAVNIDNLKNLYRFSLIAIVLEIFSLFLYMISNVNSSGYLHTILNVGCCIAACFAMILLSRKLIKEYERTGIISDTTVTVLVFLFYILLSMWGVFTDSAHYRNGEQMLTFYIVQFCFVSFIVMKPKIGSLFIALSFCIFYFNLYLIDGAAGIQPQNFLVFMVIAVLGNAIKYSILVDSEKNQIRIKELNDILQQEAVIDDLTKIKNRRALNTDINEYIGKNVCMIMADVDHFKRYNDTYGHQTGDQVLIQVADVTKNSFANGKVYRYGGDEFLIILNACADDECRNTLQAWEKAIQSIKVPGIAFRITCSSGLSCGEIESTADFADILKTADDRLYEAKNHS
jgi:diguanylate cyclase (GGDEF)-like protein